MDAIFLGQSHQLLNQRHRAGGGVNHRGTLAKHIQHTLFTKHDLRHLRRPGQRHHHGVHIGDCRSQTARHMRASLLQMGSFGRINIKDVDRITRIDQIHGHGVAHVAHPDERQFGKCAHGFTKFTNWAALTVEG